MTTNLYYFINARYTPNGVFLILKKS